MTCSRISAIQFGNKYFFRFDVLSIKYFRIQCTHISICSFQGTWRIRNQENVSLALIPHGDGEIRTLDPLLARQVLSQLSYTPIIYHGFPKEIDDLLAHQRDTYFVMNSQRNHNKMGLSGLEPPTSRLSGVRSNRLSYKPIIVASTCSPMPSPAKYHRPPTS